MATQVLKANVDEEIYQRLRTFIEEAGVSPDAIINEALKHYLCGRVPAGKYSVECADALKRDVQVSMK